MNGIQTENDRIAVALALIGPDAPLSPSERELGTSVRPSRNLDCLADIRAAILSGEDPLGQAFSRLRSPRARRAQGAIYTPSPLVDYMLSWASAKAEPRRVVDPGAGSGRFLLSAAQRFPRAELVAVELDPLAALVLRANIVVRGLAGRATILVGDYRSVAVPAIAGETLFIGNPP